MNNTGGKPRVQVNVTGGLKGAMKKAASPLDQMLQGVADNDQKKQVQIQSPANARAAAQKAPARGAAVGNTNSVGGSLFDDTGVRATEFLSIAQPTLVPKGAAGYQQSVQSSSGTVITRALKSINSRVESLDAFFEEYDVYDGRIFEVWELEEIFDYHVTAAELKRLCEENQESAKLRNRTMEYKFLHGVIRTAPDCPPNLRHAPLKSQPFSIYQRSDDEKLQGHLLNFILELLALPALGRGSPSDAFDELFGAPSRARTAINLAELQKGVVRAMPDKSFGSNAFAQFIEYVAGHSNANTFKKVNFVAAMNHLIVKLKADVAQRFLPPMPGMPNYRGATNTTTDGSQISTLSPYDQAKALVQQAVQIMQNNPGALQPQEVMQVMTSVDQALTATQSQPSTDPNYANVISQLTTLKAQLNPATVNSPENRMHFMVALNSTLQLLQVLPSSAAQPQIQHVPQSVLVLLGRIGSHLNATRQQVQDVFGPPTGQHNGIRSWDSAVFLSQCEREFHFTNNDAAEITSHFQILGQPFVDCTKFSTLASQEQTRFDEILRQYDLELRALQRGLRQRHTGVYKWFQRHLKRGANENALYLDEFQLAVRAFNAQEVTDGASQAIFAKLDRNQMQYVRITDIEGLFKEHSRRSHSNIRPDEVCTRIIRAFNGDLNYIETQLRNIYQANQNVLPLEDAIRFFEKFAGFQNFYTEEEIAFTLDSYVRSAGKVELEDFKMTLHRLMRANVNMRPNQNEQGLHQQNVDPTLGPGGESWTPLLSFGYFSADGTSAILQGDDLQRPKTNRLPRIQIEQIEELQKACFVTARTVQDFFTQSRGARNGLLNKTAFINALEELQVHWPVNESEAIFSAILGQQPVRTSQISEISAQTIDQTVHFLKKRTLKEMHGEILADIMTKSTHPSVPSVEECFKAEIQQNAAGRVVQKVCNYDQLAQVLRRYNIFPTETDVKFLASQYIVSGRTHEIHYQKLIDDINSASRAKSARGDPSTICAAIVKQVHTRGSTIREYFSQQAQAGSYVQNDLVRLLGQGLELTPSVANEAQLRFLWSRMDAYATGSVSSSVVVKYIEEHAKTVDQLKNDVLKEMSEKRDLESRFNNHPIFNSDGMRFPMGAFEETLRQLFVSKVDQQFISSFYQDVTRDFVNAVSFIQDMQLQRGGGEVISRPESDSSRLQKPIVDEREAKRALEVIAAQPAEFRRAFTQKLQRLTRGNQTSFVQMNDFVRILNEEIPQVTHMVLQILQAKYQKAGDPNSFELQAFQSDLHQLGDDVGIQALDPQTQILYTQLAKSLESANAVTRFVINLKENDRQDAGYLSDQMLVQAFYNTYRDGSVAAKLTDPQINEMMVPLSKNSQGFHNYRELLVHTFGAEKGQQYFLMERHQLETEASGATGRSSQRFQPPVRISNPASNLLGAVGTKLIASQRNYEEALKAAMGPHLARENRVNLDQIYVALNACQVRLTIDEKNGVINWFNAGVDQGTVSVMAFLNDVGLPPQTMQVKEVKKAVGRELSDQELREAQDWLVQVRRELYNTQKQPDQVIEKYRQKRPGIKGMLPKEFARALRDEAPNVKSRISNSQLSTLVHYLVKEEMGQVSFDKLLTALNLSERDPPLRQDQLDKIRAARGAVEQTLQQADIPIEVMHLLNFMNQSKISIHEMFKVVSQSGITQDAVISERQFDECCAERGYEPKDRNRLVEALMQKGGRPGISLHSLQVFKRKWDAKNRGVLGDTLQKRGARFGQDMRLKLQKISRWMQSSNFTTHAMFDQLDKNKDGLVDTKEFVDGMALLQITGLVHNDFVTLFEALDTDNNKYLSLNEFSLYIEGAQRKREERLRDIPQGINEDIEREIRQLFTLFDEDGNGKIDKNELIKTFQGLGYEIDEAKAESLLRSVSQSNELAINLEEFTNLMKPEMQNRLLEQDDRIDDFRAMFKDADTDYSGYLTADEVYAVLLKNGVDLRYEELIELMNEFDVSGDAQLDIDEFVAMMNTSSDMAFHSQGAKSTYLRIRQRRRLNVTDFMKALKSLPSAFVESVFKQKWKKESKNRPSDVFKAQLDPTTMTWKDMLPVLSEHLPPEMQTQANLPKIRPIPNQHGCEITLESAQGIPLPANGADFNRSMIMKRAVRIGIFDSVKKEYLANAAQVEATWKPNAEDKWVFTKSNISLNPVLFRSTRREELDVANTKFIFEFVIYYKKDNQEHELCCGWAGTEDLTAATRPVNLKLRVQGGSPTAEILIQESDVHKKRTGLQGLMKAFGGKITSQLTVGFKPHAQLEPETKMHMQFLPSTCLIQKKLLLFVSGYRNYAGQTLLKESSLGQFKQPGGSIVLSSFPKLVDNIDILEVLVAVWAEDVLATMSATDKKSIQEPIRRTKDIIHRIYPVLFAEEFGLTEANYLDSACFDQARYQRRKDLLMATLRPGPAARSGAGRAAAAATRQAIEDMTTFKPFNVRETKWDVWDVKEAKFEQFMNMHQGRGMFGEAAQMSAAPPQQPVAPPQQQQKPRIQVGAGAAAGRGGAQAQAQVQRPQPASGAAGQGLLIQPAQRPPSNAGSARSSAAGSAQKQPSNSAAAAAAAFAAAPSEPAGNIPLTRNH